MSSGRISTREPLLARPIGLRAVATITASVIELSVRSRAIAQRTVPFAHAALPSGPGLHQHLRSRVLEGLPRGSRVHVRDPAPRGTDQVLPRDPPPELPRRPRLLGPHQARRHLAREPQSRPVLLGPRNQHPRSHRRAERVLRLDDLDGRPEARPPAHHRLQGIHAERNWTRRGIRSKQGPHDRGSRDRGILREGIRLRRRDRRAIPAADHLRDDGHPEHRRSPNPRMDQCHPRRGRPRLRRHARELDARRARDLRVCPGTRRRPTEEPTR